MERVEVSAKTRTVASKGQLRQLRADGFVPGVVYGRKKDTIPVTVESKDLVSVMGQASGMNTLVDLVVEGGKDTVMVKELKRDILYHDRFTHVDFIRISLEDKLEVHVPIHLTGEPESIKDGGVVSHSLREVSLKCLPTEIPELLELDISGLAIGQSLTVADLVIPAESEMLADASEVIVTVLAPRIVEEEVTEDDDDAVEGDAAEAGEEETEEG